MKRQRAEISSNVISHIKSAYPIKCCRSDKLGIKEKISRGKFPRLIFSCPVPTGLPHRSHCVPMNIIRLIPVIFFHDLQLFKALNFCRFFKTHTPTHTGKGAESTGQGQTGFFLSGPVFLPHLLADDPADGIGDVLLHLGRGVSVGVQREPRRVVAQCAGQRFHVHPAFQRQRGEGVAQVMESNVFRADGFQNFVMGSPESVRVIHRCC